MAIFNQSACNKSDVIFTFFGDLKSKDVDKILSFETGWGLQY